MAISGSIGILMVDDTASFREIVRSILEPYSNLRLLGEAVDGAEAVEKARELKPDLILLDIGLPQIDGIEAARRIIEFLPDTVIVFVSMQSSTRVIQEALSTGAKGYVLKGSAGRDLWPAIQAAAGGDRFISNQVSLALA